MRACGRAGEEKRSPTTTTTPRTALHLVVARARARWETNCLLLHAFLASRVRWQHTSTRAEQWYLNVSMQSGILLQVVYLRDASTVPQSTIRDSGHERLGRSTVMSCHVCRASRLDARETGPAGTLLKILSPCRRAGGQ